MAAGVVGLPQRASPGEVTGLGLGESPAALVFHRVMTSAVRAAVGGDGGPAVGVITGVIQVGGSGAAPAADAHAVAVAHLDMAAQRSMGETPMRVVV